MKSQHAYESTCAPKEKIHIFYSKIYVFHRRLNYMDIYTCFVNNNFVVFIAFFLPTSSHFHTKIAHISHPQKIIHIIKLWKCGKLPYMAYSNQY